MARVASALDGAGPLEASAYASLLVELSAWAPIADLPSDDWGAAYAVANGRLLVSGGIIQDNAEVTNEGWSYDPGTAAWTSLPNANDALFAWAAPAASTAWAATTQG